MIVWITALSILFGQEADPKKILPTQASGLSAVQASFQVSAPAFKTRAMLVPSLATGLVQQLDIPYSELSSRLRLDVFSPDQTGALQKGPLPVLIFVHGGGWFTGDKDFFGVHRGVARALARRGYVVVVPNYRLSPEVKHPVHVQDVGRAFAWTMKNVARHGGDPSRVILMGHSAGAHLVSLLATDPEQWGKAADGPAAGDFSKIAGVVGLCGVYMIPAANEYLGLAGKVGLAEQLGGVKGPDGQVFNPFKIAFGDDEKICSKASPITHARKGLPPFLLMVAERDLPGLDYMAKEFDTALTASGNSSQVMTIAETNHVSLLRDVTQKDNEASRDLARFMAQAVANASKKKNEGKETSDADKKP